MNIIRRDPFDAPFVQMNRLFSHMIGDGFGEGGLEPASEGVLPLDVLEDEKSVIVRASLPGFSPDEVDVEVHNGILTIQARHEEENEEQGPRFLRRERRWGSVSRNVALPTLVDEQACEADLSNGVLTLRIPKSQEAMPRKIKIGNGSRPASNGAKGETAKDAQR
jgi:HSP20 family protein